MHHRQRPEDPGSALRPAGQAARHRTDYGRIRVARRTGKPRVVELLDSHSGRSLRLKGDIFAMAVVRIPTPLRSHVAGQDRTEAAGATVGEVLASLTTAYPALRDR